MVLDYDLLKSSILSTLNDIKGGPGSGNHDHGGRKGKRGGSAPKNASASTMSEEIEGAEWFHGTSADYLDSIKEKGIIVNGSGRRSGFGDHYQGERGEAVFLTRDPGTAQRYANSATKIGASTLVLKVVVPSGETLYDDDTATAAAFYKGNIPKEWIKQVSIDGISQKVSWKSQVESTRTAYLVILAKPYSTEEVKGGLGSGNHGHKGRPGVRGGSSTRLSGAALAEGFFDKEVSLTPEEQKAVKDFTGGQFTWINRSLRTGAKASPKVQERVDLIDSAMAKSGEIPKGTVLYRGDSWTGFTDLAEGKVSEVDFRSFSSTSLNRHYGAIHSDSLLTPGKIVPKGNHGLTLEIGEGVRGISVKNISKHKTEKEIVLDRGLKLRIKPGTKPEKNESGFYKLTLEVYKPKGEQKSLDLKRGPGSGNRGHGGRPGKRGGSAPKPSSPVTDMTDDHVDQVIIMAEEHDSDDRYNEMAIAVTEQDKRTVNLVHVTDGKVDAAMTMKNWADDDWEIRHIGSIKKGAGTALVREGEKRAEKAGASKIRLLAGDEGAEIFWTKMGYTKLDESGHFEKVFKKEKKSYYEIVSLTLKGGPGSGNRGHAGRPGKRGGSASKVSASAAPSTVKEQKVSKENKFSFDMVDKKPVAEALNQFENNSVRSKELVEVKISDLHATQHPHEFSREKVKEYKEAFEKNPNSAEGKEGAPEVMLYKGKMYIFNGHHRTAGASEAGREKVKVWLYTSKKKEEKKSLSHDELYLQVSSVLKGGAGSGNHGHAGRPGKRGGSATRTGTGGAPDTDSNSTRKESSKLASGLESGIESEEVIGKTAVSRVTFKDGSQAIVRTKPSDEELLSQQVAEALGYDSSFPRGIEKDGRLYQEIIDGKTPSEIAYAPFTTLEEFTGRNELFKKVLDSPEAEDIGIFDYLTGQGDRHMSNWLIKDGKPIAIDHDVSFGKTISPFTEKWSSNFSSQKMEAARASLDKTKPYFEKKGHGDRWKEMVRRADYAIKHKKFDEAVIIRNKLSDTGGLI